MEFFLSFIIVSPDRSLKASSLALPSQDQRGGLYSQPSHDVRQSKNLFEYSIFGRSQLHTN